MPVPLSVAKEESGSKEEDQHSPLTTDIELSTSAIAFVNEDDDQDNEEEGNTSNEFMLRMHQVYREGVRLQEEKEMKNSGDEDDVLPKNFNPKFDIGDEVVPFDKYGMDEFKFQISASDVRTSTWHTRTYQHDCTNCYVSEIKENGLYTVVFKFGYLYQCRTYKEEELRLKTYYDYPCFWWFIAGLIMFFIIAIPLMTMSSDGDKHISSSCLVSNTTGKSCPTTTTKSYQTWLKNNDDVNKDVFWKDFDGNRRLPDRTGCCQQLVKSNFTLDLDFDEKFYHDDQYRGNCGKDLTSCTPIVIEKGIHQYVCTCRTKAEKAMAKNDKKKEKSTFNTFNMVFLICMGIASIIIIVLSIRKFCCK